MSSSRRSDEIEYGQTYPFIEPTDEQLILDEQNLAFNELMLNRTSLARVKISVKILDVGCGTGIQTILLAERYPNSTVIGIDQDPVPAREAQPDNVVFLLGNLENLLGHHELLQRETFDFVYQRGQTQVVQDWTGHIALLRSLIKPNGWLECQETAFCRVYDENERFVSMNWRFTDIILRSGNELGHDFDVGAKIGDLCRTCGFVDVECRDFPVVYRPGWTLRPETERVGSHLNQVAPIWWRTILSRSVRPEEGEDSGELFREMEEKLLNGPVGLHSKFYVTTARKPQLKRVDYARGYALRADYASSSH